MNEYEGVAGEADSLDDTDMLPVLMGDRSSRY
jgi:hypothetical protein